MVWRTGPVGNLHRAILRDGTLVAVAESTEEAAVIVRRMNEPEKQGKELEILRKEIKRIAEETMDLSRADIVDGLEALL